MPNVSTVDGTSMPSGTDAFDPNVQLKAFQDGNAVYNKHRIYADITARDADTYPTEGWNCYVIATKTTYQHNGTSWVSTGGTWTAYTPTLTNFTLGTGSTVAFKYRVVAGYVEVKFKIILGTGGSVGNNPTFTFPVTAVAPIGGYVAYSNCSVMFYDASTTGTAQGALIAEGTSTTVVRFQKTEGGWGNLSSTSPLPWAVGDALHGSAQYEAA